MLRFCAFLLATIITLPMFGQTETAEFAELRAPGLLVRYEADAPEQPLPLESLSAELSLVGPVARTRLTLTFRNPSERVLEGRFVLPLPPGAYPSAFALDIDGKMRRASIVDRDYGRVVFEEIVRRGVDPGLLEWARGNAFRARIFPIPAGGTRTIEIHYDQELAASGEDLRYSLPLQQADVLKSFDLDLRVTAAPGTIVETPYGALGIPASGTTALTVKSGDFRPSEDIELTVSPGRDANGQRRPFVVVAETDRGPCFLTDAPIRFRPLGETSLDAMHVLWDASRSRESADFEREWEVLSGACRVLGDGIVSVTVFSNDVWFTEDFVVREGDGSEVHALLSDLTPDGNTDFRCLGELTPSAGVDHVLLFSDGVSATEAPELTQFGVPVSAITSARTRDHAALKRLTAGGSVVDLQTVAPDAALSAVFTRPMRLAATNVPVRGCEPPLTSPVTERLLVRGYLDAMPEGDLEFEIGHGGETMGVITVSLADAPRVPAEHIEHLWASARVSRLLEEKKTPERRAHIVKLAQEHSLVSPHTSLLVLETLEDYVKYRIEPPAEMREAWEEAIEKATVAKEESRAERMARLRTLWKARVDWWNGTYEFPKNKLTPEGTAAPDFPAPSFGIRVERRPNEAPATEEEAPELTTAEIFDEDAYTSTPFGFSDEEDGQVAMRLTLGAGQGGGAGAPPRRIAANSAVKLEPWRNEAMSQALDEADDPYRKYTELRKEHGASAGFYIDAADYFMEKGQKARALRILSNVSELRPDDAALLRIHAHRAAQYGALDLAIVLFEVVRDLRPEEPQSHRDLALLLASKGEYARAIELLEDVVLGDWNDRFPEIELIALGELNDVIADCQRQTGERHHTIPEDLVQQLDVDLRIVCTWDADMCDIDLHVVEPSGEKAYYGHRRTVIGGNMSHDLTRGYGPEEYLLKKVMPGKYEMIIHYYGDSRPQLAGSATVQIEIIRDYGRPTETRTSVTRRLEGTKDYVKVAEAEF